VVPYFSGSLFPKKFKFGPFKIYIFFPKLILQVALLILS
jgi:hypothetical protein